MPYNLSKLKWNRSLGEPTTQDLQGIRSAIIGFDEELRANVLDRIGSFLGPATSWISKDMEPQ